MDLIGCDNILLQQQFDCCSVTRPFSILQIVGCQRLTTNMKTVLANKCPCQISHHLDCSSCAEDEQLISTSIARVHNFSSSESNDDFKKKRQFSCLI